MVEDKIKNIIEVLTRIQEDNGVPKNVRDKIKNAVSALNEKNMDLAVKVDKSIQELDELSNDPNIQSYIRMQIWNAVSLLEGI